MSNPTLYMLIGAPATGKSTWVMRYRQVMKRPAIIYSTDDYIEMLAEETSDTYNNVFNSTNMKQAELWAEQNLKIAIKNELDIIWDQTNLNKKSRKKKLAKIPTHYTKIAVVFNLPPITEWELRLESRPGKMIPRAVLDSMIFSFEYPTLGEGFYKIITGHL